VLELLAEYFCLRVKDVARLIRDREPTEADLRTARRSLGLLWKEKLVNRLPYFELDTEARSYVYGLSDSGVKTANGHVDIDWNLVGIPKTFDEHSERTLDHELEISYFHMALSRFRRDTDNSGLYWQQADLKRGIHPDALFKLQTAKGEYAFFLEIEKGKKNFEALTAKLDRYAKYYDTDDCEKDWGFRNFRVVIVQKNDVRRQNLLRELHDKLPHRMFWLTTEKAYKSGIAGEIFGTPKDYADRRYSFLSL
jgi:hypothetical protein